MRVYINIYNQKCIKAAKNCIFFQIWQCSCQVFPGFPTDFNCFWGKKSLWSHHHTFEISSKNPHWILTITFIIIFNPTFMESAESVSGSGRFYTLFILLNMLWNCITSDRHLSLSLSLISVESCDLSPVPSSLKGIVGLWHVFETPQRPPHPSFF